MAQEFNSKQIKSFTLLLLSLQKKNTILGFAISLVPMLVTAFSIELFIGKIIGGEVHADGMKGINAIFFIFFSNAILQSTEALKNYGTIIKSSYLHPATVMISESLLQYASFIVSFLVLALAFNISFEKSALLILLSLLLALYTLAVTNCLLVVSSILEDFGRILGIIFQMLFWISPILYSVHMIKSDLVYIFMANPFYIFFELISLIFSPQSFDHHLFWWGLGSSLTFLAALYLLLMNLRKKILVFL
ncbi:ABC transporter permease [Polynucleobacter cosmopolitanus]|nr:ABC transporter permease [Polynucleobacter cosmopolitanus]